MKGQRQGRCAPFPVGGNNGDFSPVLEAQIQRFYAPGIKSIIIGQEDDRLGVFCLGYGAPSFQSECKEGNFNMTAL